MLNLSYEQITKKILEAINISEAELEDKINNKIKALDNLISKEGAAYVIANEFNIKLFETIAKELKIKDLLPGMNSVTLLAKVLTIYPLVEYKKENRQGKVQSILIGDETGTTRAVFWDENQIKSLESVKEGDIIKIRNSYCRQNRNYKELHLGSNSNFTINPQGETISEVKIKIDSEIKKIQNLNENDYARVQGTIVQLFEPRFYEACPECNKRARLEGEDFHCDVHGKVKSKLLPVANVFLDDGTSNIRVVFFRDQVASLFNKSDSEVLELKDNPNKFEELKKDLLGKQISVEGRAIKNNFSGNLEFISNNLESLNPLELIKTVK
jgi:ssDNA-binding replication factor A large subunit